MMEFILSHVEKGVMTLTLNRPERLNSFNDEMHAQLAECLKHKVTSAVMKNAGEKAIFLHCLPAFHDLKTKIGKEMGERFNLTDMEVTDEVFESAQSHVFDEAENRMHTIKAVMVATIGEPETK